MRTFIYALSSSRFGRLLQLRQTGQFCPNLLENSQVSQHPISIAWSICLLLVEHPKRNSGVFFPEQSFNLLGHVADLNFFIFEHHRIETVKLLTQPGGIDTVFPEQSFNLLDHVADLNFFFIFEHHRIETVKLLTQPGGKDSVEFSPMAVHLNSGGGTSSQ